ncbi:TolC family protein [Corallococcus sp. M34]|nr:TolC family protein [Citreicoccus inhibens]
MSAMRAWMEGGVMVAALLSGAARGGPPTTATQAPEATQVPATVQAPALTFEDAVQQSLARNPTLTQAKAQVARAQALVTEARAAFLPVLTANGVYTQLDGDRVQNDRVVQPGSAFNANLNLSVPLVAPQRWLAASRAKQAVDVARASESDVRRLVASGAAQAYLSVVLQRRLLAVAVQARDTARAHLEFSQARRSKGLGTRLDEARAQRELYDNEARVQLAATALNRSREALGVAVGVDGPLDAAGDAVLASPPALAEALKAVEQREDIASQRARLSLAERTYAESWADFMPTLSASAQPYFQTPETVTLPTWGFQAQVLLSVPLYDGGFRYGARRERAALVADARGALDTLMQRARGEVRSADEQLQGATAAAVEQGHSAESARETLQLSTEAYRAGATTNLDVVDAERTARDAETNALLAQDAVLQARLNLLVASGEFPRDVAGK